jgi:hypothetical protein
VIVGAETAPAPSQRQCRLPHTQLYVAKTPRTTNAWDFVSKLWEEAVAPHVAQQRAHRRSAVDERTTRHTGYFGWIKTIAGLRKTRHRGKRRLGWMFTLAAALQSSSDEESGSSDGLRLARIATIASAPHNEPPTIIHQYRSREPYRSPRSYFPQPARKNGFIAAALTDRAGIWRPG